MQLADDAAEKWEGDGGRLWLWAVSPTVLVTRVEGYISLEGVRFYTNRADRMIARSGSLYVFHHWGGVLSWDPQARDRLRTWAGAHGKRLPGTHFLVRSRVLAMTIEVAGLALGRKLSAHRSEATFFAALAEVTAQRARV
ncbi:MAG: hypothetical protein HOW73_30485 [Polyangiaceae bacterium]|nr:hypothetical protein [Polyangiaceae bacterium]